MKNLFFVSLLFFLSISVHSQVSNFESSENPSAEDRLICQTFTVTLNLGIVDIETSVTICCSPVLTPCAPVPSGKTTNDALIGKSQVQVKNSSIYTATDGKKYRIKSGTYPVDADGNIIYVDLEELK